MSRDYRGSAVLAADGQQTPAALGPQGAEYAPFSR